MAEFGAHLATAATELPSVFEVFAQENLAATLRPAFGHLLKVLSRLDVTKFGALWRWHEEICSVLELVLQHYCLKACGASFAENFYGLKRSPAGKFKSKYSPGYKLPASHHRRALFCLVIIPYLKQKLDNTFEKLRADEGDGISTSDWVANSKAKSIFLKLYPVLHLSWQLLILYYQVNYTLGRKTFPSPLYEWARTQLVTLTDDDDTSQPIMDLWNDICTTRWRYLPAVVLFHSTNNARELFTSVLSLGTFFLQFVEWWYSNDDLSANLAVSFIPPPEKTIQKSLPADSAVCPLCLKTRTNDTALSVSGYVFCYPCIYRHVSLNGKCPITRLPCDTSNLVRLYTNNAT